TANPTTTTINFGMCMKDLFDGRAGTSSIACRGCPEQSPSAPRCYRSERRRSERRLDLEFFDSLHYRLAAPVSGEDVRDHVPVHVRQPKAAALKREDQPFVVNAQKLQDGCLQVVDVDGAGSDRVLVGVDWVAVRVGDVVAVGVGLAVGETAFDARAGQPNG